jgi:hypothetical protein
MKDGLEFSLLVNYFSDENPVDQVHGAVDQGNGSVHGGPGCLPLRTF